MTAAAIALNRFGLGARPGDPVPADARRWLLEQFGRYEPLPAAWAAQPRTAQQLQQLREDQRMVREAASGARQAQRREMRRDARGDYLEAITARTTAALQTQAPFVERLVHFWANHFAVSVDKQAVVGLAGAFEADTIRPHVLGRFEDMLLAVLRHPAMLLYLDQAQSIGPGSGVGLAMAERNPQRRRGLNENLAREVLELHTLGVRSGYTQEDVTELARALTGWGVADPTQQRDASPAQHAGFQFRPGIHEPGERVVLGRRYGHAGEAQALAIARDLARHPATARNIATKLARHFVADEPPAALVRRLAEVFQREDGALPAVYRALVESPEAWSAASSKFKTPWEWTLSSLRALSLTQVPGVHVAAFLNELGQAVWRPGSPAGFDDVAASWAAPDALLRRVEGAQRLATLTGGSLDARALAPKILPGVLGDATAGAIARAESPATGLALLLVSPEFLRR